MRVHLTEITRSYEGKLRVTFEVDAVDELRGMEGELDIAVKKYREGRSLSANAYFHVLVGKIADAMLDELSERASSVGVELVFDQLAKERIINEGYDPKLGARPLRRTITKLIEDVFSESLLSGEIKKGDRVIATVKNGETVLVKK